jgi:aromatic ring-opening dioxygenase catalytic subunit (LigB family)
VLISHALLVPHVPTLVVDQHRGHPTEMLQALEQASQRLVAEQPEIVVALSARWISTGPFLVGTGARHATITDYTGFGVELRYECLGAPALGRALVDAGQKAKVAVGPTARGIDSGITVPLHFLLPSRSAPVVPLSIAPRARDECRRWGEVLRATVAARKERVAFVVGGLLTHHEHAWNLGRDVPEARELDQRVLDLLARGEWEGLEAGSRDLAAKAQPEAGLRHLDVLRGFLGDGARGELKCYESSPGIGAALVEFPITRDAAAGAAAPASGGPA